MNSISMADPLDYMARLCKAHLTDDDGEHYHIFLNSVAGITRIIRLAGLAPKDCRIVCSQSESSKNKNQEKLPEGFQIASTLDPVRLFNFYTATCFEGQDIYDVNGRTFIISEKYKDHTKVDIRTTLPQICGRIRDSRFNGEINQFYAVSPYKDVSQEEFREMVLKDFEIAKKDAEQFNSINVSPEGKAILLQHASERKYLIVDKDDKIVADENLAFFDIVNYGIVNGQYSSRYNMNTNLEEAGFKVSNDATGYKLAEELENCSVQSVTRRPFKEVFEKYCVLKTEPGTYDLSMSVNRIEQDKPLVKEAYDVLGPEKVRQMKYNQSNIKRELVKVAHEKFDKKVFMLLNGQIKRGFAIPRTEIKEKLEGIYKSLGSNQKAKATDLQK